MTLTSNVTLHIYCCAGLLCWWCLLCNLWWITSFERNSVSSVLVKFVPRLRPMAVHGLKKNFIQNHFSVWKRDQYWNNCFVSHDTTAWLTKQLSPEESTALTCLQLDSLTSKMFACGEKKPWISTDRFLCLSMLCNTCLHKFTLSN